VTTRRCTSASLIFSPAWCAASLLRSASLNTTRAPERPVQRVLLTRRRVRAVTVSGENVQSVTTNSTGDYSLSLQPGK